MRRILLRLVVVVVGLVGGVVLAAVIVGTRLAVPAYRGNHSDHFDGTHFVNRVPIELPGLFRGIRYWFSTKPGPWADWTENEHFPPPPARVGHGELQVTFINHATVLLQMDGLNILTDPIWSDRCSPFTWAGPKRRRAPGIDFDALPKIDLVLISHNHYDHMDLPTLERLAGKHSPKIVTGLGNAAFLANNGIEAFELDWGQSTTIGGVEVRGMPERHFSGRGLGDRNTTLWEGFMLRGPAGAVYFAGDTGFGPHFEEAGREFGPFRLSLLPIGAYNPRWFMGSLHISPEEAVEAHKLLRASTSVAIHFGTFRLSEEGQNQPVTDLEAALAKAGEPRPEFWVLGFGESRAVPPVAQP